MKFDEKTLTPYKKKKFEKLGIKTNTVRFKRYFNAGLLNNIDELFIKQVQEYWKKNYNKEIDPVLHLAFKNLTGRSELRIISRDEIWKEIIPFFNDQNMQIGYRDKNIYDILIDTPYSVENVVKRIRGNYYDNGNNIIGNNQVYNKLFDHAELIIKPSDSNNGFGINKLYIKDEQIILNDKPHKLIDLEKLYGYNFIIQKVINQHPIMAAPHPESVNTLRMVTLRWRGDIKYLLTFARFGANNEVKDNAGSGGVCVGVKDTGEFLNIGIDENSLIYTHHPTTNYPLKNLGSIPNFNDFKQFVIELHKKILHHDFISWDIAIDDNENPVFIEANFAGATWLYQLATQKPLFGELTEEVLQYVSQKLSKNISRDITRSRGRKKSRKNKAKKLRNKNKKLNEQLKRYESKIDQLELQIENKDWELQKFKSKYNQIISSRTWRYTSFIRRIGRFIRSTFKNDI